MRLLNHDEHNLLLTDDNGMYWHVNINEYNKTIMVWRGSCMFEDDPFNVFTDDNQNEEMVAEGPYNEQLWNRFLNDPVSGLLEMML